MGEFRGHRGFAAVYDWMARHESGRERELRQALAGRANGSVLEIGVGPGANWQYLPAGIEYVGVEPDRFMLQRARKLAASRGEERDVRQARAEDLPFEDGSFDTVLMTLTLCSVEDPAVSLREVGRVLRPGGSLLFYEHVRPAGLLSGGASDVIAPAWRFLMGGCNPNRRTGQTIASSGLEVGGVDQMRLAGLTFIHGAARKNG